MEWTPYRPVSEVTPRPPAEQFQFQSQQQVPQEVIPAPTVGRQPAPVHPGSGAPPGRDRCPERTPLSDLCLPLSQHQRLEAWRQSPRSLGLWVRAPPTAGENGGTGPEIGVAWVQRSWDRDSRAFCFCWVAVGSGACRPAPALGQQPHGPPGSSGGPLPPGLGCGLRKGPLPPDTGKGKGDAGLPACQPAGLGGAHGR